jgi:photosystem II stability/assembly factor-like uncharacterized protein
MRRKMKMKTPKLLATRGSLFVSALLVGVVILGSLFFNVKDLCAHSPHDPIDALAVSPAYSQDQTLFIAISDQLLRSMDGGFSWKGLTQGLDNKRLLSAITIAPSYRSDRTLFVSSDGDGIYRSQDGGDSWAKVNSGLGDLSTSLLAIDPKYNSSRVVLAAGAQGGLYRTKNGGNSWYQVFDKNTRITAMAFSPDLRKAYAVAGDHTGVLYLSTDGGDAWQQITQFSGAGAITSIALSTGFSLDGTFFVGTEQAGILQTRDGGLSFTQANTGLPFTAKERYGTLRKSNEGPLFRWSEKDVVSVLLSPNYETDSTVFANMWNQAVFKSDNGGHSWQRQSLGLTCDFQADSEVYRSPHFRGLAISDAFAEDDTVFLGGFDGLFKSTDGGRRWMQMETLPIGLIKGLTLSPGDRGSLAIALTTYGGGAYTTDDQGNTWAINNKGLNTTRLSGIVFSPNYHSDDTICSASKGYLLKSTDRGSSWAKIALARKSWRAYVVSGLRKLGIPDNLARRILPTLEREKPYPTVLAISPDYASDATIYFGTRLHGIYRSEDGGLDARPVWDGMGRTITSLAISPDFRADRTLFAGARGAGIYKTADGGNTWQAVNNGLSFIDAWQRSVIVHQIHLNDIQLTISPHYRVDRTVFAASAEGLFQTTDGGDSWRELEGLTQEKSNYIMTMAISPNYASDKTLIASVKGGGLFKTANGGETFAQVGPDLINSNHAIEYMAFSEAYATDNTVYAASDEELFRSTDGGNTWQAITRPVRYENMREVLRYEGQWSVSKDGDYSAGSVTGSDVAQSRAVLDFVGTGIVWIGTKASDQGIARVYIDGNHAGDVDQFGDAQGSLVRSYSITDLRYGPHTVTIEVTGSKNPKSTGNRIEIDAIDILQ